MSRCSLCDYSQSAPSLYNAGLPTHSNNNRIVQSATHGYVCISCLEAIQQAGEGFEDPDRDVESADEIQWDDEEFDAPVEIETD